MFLVLILRAFVVVAVHFHGCKTEWDGGLNIYLGVLSSHGQISWEDGICTEEGDGSSSGPARLPRSRAQPSPHPTIAVCSLCDLNLLTPAPFPIQSWRGSCRYENMGTSPPCVKQHLTLSRRSYLDAFVIKVKAGF